MVTCSEHCTNVTASLVSKDVHHLLAIVQVHTWWKSDVNAYGQEKLQLSCSCLSVRQGVRLTSRPLPSGLGWKCEQCSGPTPTHRHQFLTTTTITTVHCCSHHHYHYTLVSIFLITINKTTGSVWRIRTLIDQSLSVRAKTGALSRSLNFCTTCYTSAANRVLAPPIQGIHTCWKNNYSPTF